MQVKDLTTEEFKTLIRETVLEVLADSLDDPDIGLKLRPEIEQQLLAAQSRRATGQGAGTSAAEQMKSFYEPGNELAQWTDEDPEDFQDYQSYT